MTFNDSITYFVPQTESAQLFSLKNLDAMAKYCSKLKLPRITTRRNTGSQSIDSHTLNDIGLDSHQVMFRLKNRDLLQ